jgi:cholesterol transport system auxiliary component
MRMLLVLMATAALPACFSGLNSKIPPPQRYVLQVESANAPGAVGSDASVEVLRPSSAPGLGGDGIVVLRSGARLDFYSNARWADAAPLELQGLVIDALRTGGHFATVESDSGPFAAQYLLSMNIENFQAEYLDAGPPTVLVTLTCTLGRRSDRRVIVSFTAQGSVKADADRMQAVIAAFGQATSQVMMQIATSTLPPTAAAH